MAASPEELIRELRQVAQQRLVASFAGTGLIGRVISQKFAKRDQEKDSRVADAINEQNSVQNKINTTIVKLEPIVAKIAKTVNIIAKVWSKHVFAKQEELRQKRERLSKEKAAAEEEENERKQAEQEAVRKSSLTGIEPNQEATGKGGILGALFSSSRSTKSFVKRAILGIGAFLLGTAGLTAALYVANRGAMQLDDEQEQEGDARQQEPAPQTEDQDTSGPQESETQTQSPEIKPSVAASDVQPSEPQTQSSDTPAPSISEVAASVGLTVRPGLSQEAMDYARRNYEAEQAGIFAGAQEAGIFGVPSSSTTTQPSSTLVSQPSLPALSAPQDQTTPVSTPTSIPTFTRTLVEPSQTDSTPPPQSPGYTPVTNAPVSTSVEQKSITAPPPPTQSEPYQTTDMSGEVQQPVDQPTPQSTPTQTAPSVQNIINQLQQVGGKIDSPSSMISAMSGVATSLTGVPSTLASDIASGLSGVSSSFNPSSISPNIMSPNVGSGNEISSLSNVVDNMIRGVSRLISPTVTSQPGTVDGDAVMDGDPPLLPSPIASRGSLDVGTTFDSQY